MGFAELASGSILAEATGLVLEDTLNMGIETKIMRNELKSQQKVVWVPESLSDEQKDLRRIEALINSLDSAKKLHRNERRRLLTLYRQEQTEVWGSRSS